MHLKRLLGAALRRLAAAATSTTSRPAAWFVDWLHESGVSDAGVPVNARTIMQYAPIWYGVHKIAGNVAQMPLVLYQQTDERRRRRAVEHPAYRLLKKRPNRLMGAAVFKELLQYHAVVHGNGRAAIDRNVRGDPVELIPLLPERTWTGIVDGEKWHVTQIRHEDGTSASRKFRDRDVLHIAGLGDDGLVGYPLWQYARHSLGLGLASERAASRHFKNDAMPGFFLQSPPGAFRDDVEAAKFLADFRRAHEGLDNKSRVGLLREGITAHALSTNASDGQWIEQRRFQRQEAALWLLLESILGDDSSVSYNSLEQKNLAYLINCLNRWLVKWEEECDEKLLRQREKELDSHYYKFVTGALLKSDTATTMATGATAVSHRILSPNEVRGWFELDPYDGGDAYANPAITPGDASGAGEDLAEGGGDGQARALLVARLEDLVAVESKRVLAAAGRSANFVAWVDGFYTDARFMPAIRRATAACGGEEWHAVEYADRSKRELLEAAGRATRDTLAAEVACVVAAWPARAAELADALRAAAVP